MCTKSSLGLLAVAASQEWWHFSRRRRSDPINYLDLTGEHPFWVALGLLSIASDQGGDGNGDPLSVLSPPGGALAGKIASKLGAVLLRNRSPLAQIRTFLNKFFKRNPCDEPFVPDEYWQRYAPDQIAPTGSPERMFHRRISGRTGRIEDSTVIYDRFGRQRLRIDHTDHMRPASHSNPHYHERTYHPSPHNPHYTQTQHNLD